MVRTRCVVPEPDPGAEKRSPGTATGAKQKCKTKSRRKNTKKRSEPQAIVSRTLTVTHGQTTAGHVHQVGNEFTATSAPAGVGLGTFRSLKQVADAVSDAYEATP
jgi:uncharacterized protein (DUF2345 family)